MPIEVPDLAKVTLYFNPDPKDNAISNTVKQEVTCENVYVEGGALVLTGVISPISSMHNRIVPLHTLADVRVYCVKKENLEGEKEK